MSTLNRIIDDHSNAFPGLVKRWFGMVILIGIFLGLVYLWLQIWWTPQYANRWLGLAAFFSGVVLAIVWRGLSYNYRSGERKILPSMGIGNQLTILRGIMIAFLAGFLFSPWPSGWLAWLPGIIYILAALLDLFDGYLARRTNQVTRLGEILDMNLDGLGVLIACLLIVQYGQVPFWFLLVGLARYMFITGEWALDKLGKPVFELTTNPARRPLAGAQMGFIAVVLLPIFSPPGTYLVAGLFAAPFLVGFTFDWLTVSGVLRINTRPQFETSLNVGTGLDGGNTWRKAMRDLVARWLPLVSRTAVVVLLTVWLLKNIPGVIDQWGSWSSDLSSMVAHPGFWLGLMLLLTVIGLVFLVLGAAGRLAALLILFGIGIFQNYANLGWMEIMLLVGATVLMYLGTGPYSLWALEERIIAKRIGEE
ncbi:MAG: CDP-alcohol phosphatidyltransferase family protein [Anaerolineales bacterium]